MKKFLTALLLASFVLTGCGGEKTADNSATKVEQPAPSADNGNFFDNGQFKVDTDLPAGEYIAIGTGYVEVATSPEGGNSIVVNDNIVNAQRYITAQAGEYVKVTGDIKLYPVANAPKIDASNGKVPAGQFKCGTDIAAGEYKVTLDKDGYFAVTKSTTGRDFVKNQFAPQGGSFYATVADGQFLQIKNGTAEFVGATQVAPARISLSPSIGSTRSEFDAVYRQTNTNGVGNARYNQDVWQARFLDANGNATDDKNGRAVMVTVQVVTGAPFEPIQLDSLLPSDATNLQYDDKGSDNMLRVQNVTGTSAQLAEIFPKSGGTFSGSFNWDAATGKFIGGTITVKYPLPSNK